MHIRYVPKKKLNFHYLTPDGRMALVYDTNDERLKSRAQMWKYVATTAIPAAILAPSLVPMDMLMFVYPMLFLPSLVGLF